MSRALVILSGGQDSTTCLFWAKQHFDEVHTITFNYGQRHAIEITAARSVAVLAGVASHTVVQLGEVLLSASPLTSDNPLEQYESFDEMDAVIGDRVEKTFVPLRNSLFFTIAANHAVAKGCDALVTGICQADNANYPDCTEAFRASIESSINESLGAYRTAGPTFEPLSLLAPLMYLSKSESVQLARTVDGAYTALAFSHTAYDGAYPPVGKDHATVLRAKGFLDAGVPDPLVVRAWHEGRMSLPITPNYHDAEVLGEIVKHIELDKQLLEKSAFNLGD